MDLDTGHNIFHVINCAFAVKTKQNGGCKNGQLISVNTASKINVV